MSKTSLSRIKFCPYCGKQFKGGCSCPYGDHVRMHLDFDDKLKELYIKKFCPYCGERSSKRVCTFCNSVFDHEDMFY